MLSVVVIDHADTMTNNPGIASIECVCSLDSDVLTGLLFCGVPMRRAIDATTDIQVVDNSRKEIGDSDD